MNQRIVITLAVLALTGLGSASAGETKSALTAAVEAPAPEAPPPAAPGDPVTVFAWDEMDFDKTDVGQRIQLMNEASRTLGVMEVHITTLNPGLASHPPHQHPNEEIVVLQSGELEVYVNGETKRIGPGSVMIFLSNDWHAVNNVGTEPATYHVINFHPEG